MADQALARDAETVLGYSTTGLYAFWLYSLGPVFALLHDDLRLSYAVTSLHSTLWAAGTVLTGITFGRLAQRSGRWRLTWIAAIGASAGAALLAGGNTLALTLLAAGVLGYFGTILQTAAAALLSDHHGSDRGRALLEANIVASCAAVLAPLAVGALAATAAGGRAALLLPVVGLAALFLAVRGRGMRSTDSLRPSTAPVGSGRPPGYWRGCTLVAAVVAGGVCVIFYAPPLRHPAVA